jgi:uncharacterized membrane protein YqjE
MLMGKRAAGRDDGPTGFLDLVERLFADMAALLDQKLTLLTIELKYEGAVAARSLLVLLVGAVFATLGLLLLGIAVALWIGTDIQSVPGGYGIVGIAFTFVGGGLLAAMRRRLTKQHLVPWRTLEELRKDAKWIKDKL